MALLKICSNELQWDNLIQSIIVEQSRKRVHVQVDELIVGFLTWGTAVHQVRIPSRVATLAYRFA
jgi:hypothetical protein